MSKASIYYTLNDPDGKYDIKEIKRELDTLHGVLSVSVNDYTNHVAVDFDTSGVNHDSISKKLEKIGYEILDFSLENHNM